VQTFPEGWQEDCVKAAVQREKADGWEKRCEELEQENRELKEDLEYARQTRAEACEALADLENERGDLNEELDVMRKENADLQHDHREMLDRIAELEQELRDTQERIREQDVTIAKYDDENRKLRRVLGVYEIPLSIMDEADSVFAEARGIGKAFRCWAGIIHDNAVEHGWWDEDRSFGDIVALCHSELSEALEEYRNGKPMSYEGENGKPEGVAVEMIDCIIRILDWCGKKGIDVDELLRKKHEYNKGRPYRHGGKKL